MHKDIADQLIIVTFSTSEDNSDKKVIEAELRMAVLTASSNISLAFHDKLSPAIRSSYSDSSTGKNYYSASTCILNAGEQRIFFLH